MMRWQGCRDTRRENQPQLMIKRCSHRCRHKRRNRQFSCRCSARRRSRCRWSCCPRTRRTRQAWRCWRRSESSQPKITESTNTWAEPPQGHTGLGRTRDARRQKEDTIEHKRNVALMRDIVGDLWSTPSQPVQLAFFPPQTPHASITVPLGAS